MEFEKYDIYKPAHILLGKYQYNISSGVKINNEDFSFEFVTSFQPILCKIYEKADSFDIIGRDGNHYILLDTCKITHQDLAANQSMLCRGKFLRKGFFADSD